MTAVKIDPELNLDNTSLVLKKISENDYAVFKHEGEYCKIIYSRDYIYQNWLPKSGLKKFNSFELHHFQNRHEKTDVKNSIVNIYIPLG